MPCQRVCTPVEQLQPFEWGCIVGLREAWWNIDELLHMMGPIYWWCVSAFNSGLWDIPASIDHVLDGRIVEVHVKIDILCEQRWLPEQHPGKKSGHRLHLLCHQRALETICLQRDSEYMCFWPGYHFYHDTAKHGYSGLVKELTGVWNGTVLSTMMRIGSSVCEWWMYLCMV